MRTISPQAYDGNGLVWDVTQDDRGLLYIASSYGVQQYDGARWRFRAIGNRTTPQALAVDSTGTLHVGAKDELGMFRPDSTGRLQYRSLRAHVPDTHRPVGAIWAVAATSDAVLYRAQTGVLRWADGEMTAVTDSASGVFACTDTAFVQGPRGGLYRMDGAALALVDGGKRFEGTTIVDVLPNERAGRRCEVVTAEQGRFVLTETGSRPRLLPGGPMDAPIVSVARAPGGGLAVATEWTVRLVGPNGTRHRLTRSDGQLPGEVKQLYMSRRAALWIATTDGLARVAWPDPVTLLTEPPALQAITGPITRHEEGLAVGTEMGVWQVGPDTARHLASDGHVYGLRSTPAGLLGTGTDGVFVVRDGRMRVLTDEKAFALQQSRLDSTAAYATLLDEGVLRLRRKGERWRIVDRTDRVETSVYSVAQSPDGGLWLGTGTRGILRLGPPTANLDTAPLARFDTSDGLPAPTFHYTTQLGDSVRFPTSDGLYRRTGTAFVPDPRFGPVYTDGVRNSWFAVLDDEGGVWFDFGGHKLGVARGWPADTLRWRARPFRRVADVGDVWGIYPDAQRDSLVWFGAEGALVRYDRRLQRFGGHASPFRTLLRGVRTRGDSLLYGGDTNAAQLSAPIAFEHNHLRFQFGATSYEQIEGPLHGRDRPRQYRWTLTGYDDGWTDWTTEAHADYTGLPPGTYTMRVEARNLYDVVGQRATLSFTVRPPWYRTWAAYGLYGLLALGLGAGAVQWRTRQLRRRQKVLEETVAERTEQIREKNSELARQAEKLKELDEAKSRFFANVSHEFRTPLTLIRGPVQKVRERLQRADVGLDGEAEQLAMAERNTDRLRRLVEQLLGLARMDAGAYELAARPTDLHAEVRRIVRTFRPLAERHGLTVAVCADNEAEAEAESVYVDREALEHVLGNLLSNAIKFTPEGGTVTVTVTDAPDHGAVSVRDTGPGIPEAAQDTVFDRFAQGDTGPAGDQEGLGIGLAFTKDLVNLHNGTVDLNSAEGEGTTVTVRFPRGDAHLADDQVAPDESVSASASGPAPESPNADRSASDAFSTPEDAEASDSSPSPDDPSTFPPSDSRLVLVVDDNADVRRFVRSVLAPDFTVIEAADGADGLDRAREALPDCILADVMMPEMDGVAMTRHLRKDPATESIPVVMLTARAGPEHEVEGLEAGADDYVTKPFDADVLRARVAGMIEVRQRLRRRIREELRQSGDGQADHSASGDASPPRLVVPTATDDEPAFVQTVRAAVEEHLADPDLSVEQLASEVAVSRSTLYRRLKDEADCTPSQFIRQVRVEHGARLLQQGEGTVSEVAYAVGFNSLSYFSRQFHELLGQPPSEYAQEGA